MQSNGMWIGSWMSGSRLALRLLLVCCRPLLLRLPACCRQPPLLANLDGMPPPPLVLRPPSLLCLVLQARDFGRELADLYVQASLRSGYELVNRL